MFSLKDFPIGSHFYWIRQFTYGNKSAVVYTRYQVHAYDKQGNLISKTFPDGNCIYLKEKYSNFNARNMIVPEIYYLAYHYPEQMPKTALSELQKLFGTGSAEIDLLVKEATISFDEWKNKNIKQMF